MKNPPGQVLLLALMIGLLLILVIPTIMFLNHAGGRHQIMSQQRTKGLSVAEEGVSFMLQKLGTLTPAEWYSAHNANTFTPITECNSANAVITASGGRFLLQCSNQSTIFPGLDNRYQVGIKITALLPGAGPNGFVPARAITAFLSRKTLGGTLPTGMTAPAALQLVMPPLIAAGFNDALFVHWGPIVVHSAGPFMLTDPLDKVTIVGVDYIGYPRKFSNGPIQGTFQARIANPNVGSTLAITDNKEYWAYASMNVPPVINLTAYEAQSKVGPAYGPGPTFAPNPAVSNTARYFETDNISVASFNAGSIVGAPAGSIFFVKGNAHFDNLSLDLGNGAFIVTGDLTLGSAGAGNAGLTLNVPANARQEYPFLPSSQIPCSAVATTGGTCSVTTANQGGGIHFRGFLYVGGNLRVQGGGGSNTWRIAGAVHVGDISLSKGELIINDATPAQLRILYDPLVNRNVQTFSNSFQVDFLKESSP